MFSEFSYASTELDFLTSGLLPDLQTIYNLAAVLQNKS